MQLALAHWSDDDIARKLGCCAGTVRVHRHRVMRRVGVSCEGELRRQAAAARVEPYDKPPPVAAVA